MTPQGLQLLYLPPFSIVARFFITALLFGLLEAFFLIYQSLSGSLLLPPAVHLFTVGFMGMTMIGALFQMLPVVAGAVIEEPLDKAFKVHLFSTAGTLLLFTGFLRFEKASLASGLFLLLSSFGGIALYMLIKLLKVKNLRDAPRGFVFALSSFLLGLVLATLAVFHLLGLLELNYFLLFDLHLSFMLWGWTATLVASVSFQVIEMFFVTPPYPSFITRYLPPAVFGLLTLKLALPSKFWDFPLSLLFALYASYTVKLLTRRRRQIPDPLVYLWYVSMAFLALSALLYPLREKFFLPFLISFGTFVLSVVGAMMLRIIPFLVWMHLTTQGVKKAPTMHKVIEPSDQWLVFSLQLALVASYLFLWEGYPLITALFFFAHLFMLFFFVSKGVLLYVRLKKA